MRIGKSFWCLLLASLGGSPLPALAQPTIVGWLEPVKLGNDGLVIPAKLDTGADISSLGVTDLTWIRRADGDWVAFEVAGKDDRKVRLERKVERIARVKKASGGVQERPTVMLGVCLGGVYRVTEVNLTDRTGFKLPFLIGRNFLGNHFAVDSSRTDTLEPACTTTVASAEISR